MTALTDEQLTGLAKNFDGAGPDYLANRLLATIATLKADMAQAERKGMEKANALAHLVKSYQLADTELRRADDAGTQPRMQRAGNRIFMARSRMFKAAQAIRDMAGGLNDTAAH